MKKFEYKRIPASITVGGEEFKFTVARRVDMNTCKTFNDIVLAEVFDDGYKPWMVMPACDYAALTLYTDIGGVSKDNVYDFINTTDIVKLIEQTCDLEQLSMLKVSAHKLCDYYAEAAIKRTGTLEKLEKLIDDADAALRRLATIDIDPEDIKKLSGVVDKLGAVDDKKIIEFVTDRIKEE